MNGVYMIMIALQGYVIDKFKVKHMWQMLLYQADYQMFLNCIQINALQENKVILAQKILMDFYIMNNAILA